MFNAEISVGSALQPESHRLARMLQTKPTPQTWDAELHQGNLLQKTLTTTTLLCGPIEVQCTNVAPFVRANCKDDYQLAWVFSSGH